MCYRARDLRTRTLALAGATLLSLAGLYALLAGGPDGPVPGPKTYRVVLRNGWLISSPAVLDAVEGDAVTLRVLSDKPATLHVHEYEQQFVVTLKADVEAVATFTAGRAGRFPVHVIGIDTSHPEVAAIQVHPR
jgi:hypothetical protein